MSIADLRRAVALSAAVGSLAGAVPFGNRRAYAFDADGSSGTFCPGPE